MQDTVVPTKKLQDTVRSITRSTVQFLGGTLFSRVTGLGRDVATAYAFGTNPSVAALLVAFRFSHLLRRILGEGALQSAFTPYYEGLRKNDQREASQFFVDVQAGLGLALLFITALSSVILSLVYNYTPLSSGNAEIIKLTAILMPGLLFICLYGLNAAYLQCQQNYWVASAAPSLLNIGWILGALLLAHSDPATAMPWLAACIVLSTALQWAATLPAAWKTLIVCPFKFNLKNFHLFALLKPLGMGTIGVAAAQINSAADAIFARYVDLEGPAFLWYALRLQQLPLALFGIAVANAILPPLSRAIKEGNLLKFKSFESLAFRSTLAMMLPITLGLYFLGGWGIGWIFGHGDFHADSIIKTQECLQGYAIGLIPMALVIISVQGFYACSEYRIPMMASVVSIVVNFALNCLFIFVFSWGCASIAWATGISAWVNWLILLTQRDKVLKRPAQEVS